MATDDSTGKFRRWRQHRPFWGALLMLLSGLELFWSANSDLTHIQVHVGPQGFLSYVLPSALLLCGALVMFSPVQRLFYGIVGILVALYSFIGLNLGGFFLGMLLGIVGGALVIAWGPPRPRPLPPPAELPPTDAPPAYAPLAYAPPAHLPPAHLPPAHVPPASASPAYVPPGDLPPASASHTSASPADAAAASLPPGSAPSPDLDAGRGTDEYVAIAGHDDRPHEPARTTTPDPANPNAGHSDAGHSETGHSETGHSDAGHSETGHSDAGGSDAGGSDAGDSDAGSWYPGIVPGLAGDDEVRPPSRVAKLGKNPKALVIGLIPLAVTATMLVAGSRTPASADTCPKGLPSRSTAAATGHATAGPSASAKKSAPASAPTSTHASAPASSHASASAHSPASSAPASAASASAASASSASAKAGRAANPKSAAEAPAATGSGTTVIDDINGIIDGIGGLIGGGSVDSDLASSNLASSDLVGGDLVGGEKSALASKSPAPSKSATAKPTATKTTAPATAPSKGAGPVTTSAAPTTGPVKNTTPARTTTPAHTSTTAPSSTTATARADDVPCLGSRVLGKLAAGNDLPTVAAKAGLMEVGSLTLYNASYDGVVKLPTGNGTTIRALKFSMTRATNKPFTLTLNEPGGGKTVIKSKSLTTSGSVKFYTSRLHGNLFGLIPVTFTPDSPPPLTLPILWFTNAKIQLNLVRCNTLTADKLHIVESN